MDKEKQWIKQIKKNSSHDAANKLISKYYKEMYVFVYKQTLDMELSMDVTQEIFISVLKSIHHYDNKKASFRTWIYKIAANRLVDYYRSKHYKYIALVEPLDDYDVEDEEDMTVSIEYKEDIEKITLFLNQMDASSQQIVRLKIFGEYTLQEIASILQIPLSTVKTRYYAAIKKIKKFVVEEAHG